jgi:hypothetical protein
MEQRCLARERGTRPALARGAVFASLASLGALGTLGTFGTLGISASLGTLGTLGTLGIIGSAAACTPSHAGGAGQTYAVRARITALPTAGVDPRLLVVRHEAIDHFVGHDGKVTTMDAMEMPFPLAPDVSLAGIGPGDAVEFTLHVDWEAEREIEITGLRRLPRR